MWLQEVSNPDREICMKALKEVYYYCDDIQ